jgi:hypothetical protein
MKKSNVIVSILVVAVLVGGIYDHFANPGCPESDNQDICNFFHGEDEKIASNDYISGNFFQEDYEEKKDESIKGLFPNVQKFLNFFRRDNS